MLVPQSRLFSTHELEVPERFNDFAVMSTDVLQLAHEQDLWPADTAVKAVSDYQAHRVYLECHFPESRDYEFLAVHFGASSLSVCLEHRHEFARRDDEYVRTSVVLEKGYAHAHHSNLVRIGPSEDITENETAGTQVTDRLRHSLATFGLHQLVIEPSQASLAS